MNAADIQTTLDADLAAYHAASTAAERQAALAQWLDDATPIIGAIAQRLEKATLTSYPVRRLVRLLIDRGVIWNPELRSQIGDDGA